MTIIYTNTICLEFIKDVMEFVRLANQVNGSVKVSRGGFVVDGKSLMGLFSLDISKDIIVTVEVDEYNDEAFQQFREFLIAFDDN